MCSGAIFWANVRRAVYGHSERTVGQVIYGRRNKDLITQKYRIGRKSMFVFATLTITRVSFMLEITNESVSHL